MIHDNVQTEEVFQRGKRCAPQVHDGTDVALMGRHDSPKAGHAARLWLTAARGA